MLKWSSGWDLSRSGRWEWLGFAERAIHLTKEWWRVGVSIPTWREVCLALVYDCYLALNSSNLPGRRLLLNTLNDAVQLHHDSSQNTSKKGRPSSEQGCEDPRRSEREYGEAGKGSASRNCCMWEVGSTRRFCLGSSASLWAPCGNKW